MPGDRPDAAGGGEPAAQIAGGRVVHHLEAGLHEPKNTVMFVGYQAAGTRGRLLVDGAKAVRMKGHDVAVASRIEKLDSMSAHADSAEILRWLGEFPKPPRMTYLVHGEPGPMDVLKAKIEEHLQWAVHTPQHLEEVAL